VALPPVACAAMFANAFPFRPAAVAGVTGNFRPEMSDPADQLRMNSHKEFIVVVLSLKNRPAARLFQTFVLASLDIVR
jgi:hypothetical protein